VAAIDPKDEEVVPAALTAFVAAGGRHTRGHR
jgi:hypothetical protein